MGTAGRALLMAGGAVVMAAGIMLAFFAHGRVLEMTGLDRLGWGLALRAFEAAVLYGGSWLVIRGWNGLRGRTAA
ncbi:hypothetical protein [Streptomyces sp. NPDC049555]|uniref:hypothetical protein n=1 Tax=Streptomyces sp. NPDC049555 TaxID=3154930 RepID=UPI00341ACAE8